MRILRSVSVCAVIVAVVAWGSPARAHATYADSDPQDGATVDSAPAEVWAHFTEPLAGGSSLAVFDACGEQVDLGNTAIEGYDMTIGVSADTAGRYVVEYVAVSGLDGHTTTGNFSFTATNGVPCAGAEEEPAEQEAPGAPEAEQEQGEVAPPSGGSDPAASSVTPERGKHAKHAVKAKRQHEQRSVGAGAGKRDGDEARVPSAADATDLQPQDPAAWDLPLDGLLIALALAAVIGAVGGNIYAGIMGPR